ncbi:MAG TPA: HAD-IIIC family phosphatase [Flavobacteriales bacterium]
MELFLVSDFNVSNFANILRSRSEGALDVHTAPLDQVVPFLGSGGHADADAFVWTRPERISPELRKALDHGVADPVQLLADTDAFADLLIDAASRWRTLHVPLWQLPAETRFGRRELHHSSGVFALLLRMQHQLSERIADTPNIRALNSQRWLQQAGPTAWSEKLWYLTKTPFSNEVFKAAADDLLAGSRIEQGRAIKLIVLDLDDTLWGGIVGDDGWENLQLGGHDATGEAFVDFQRTLKALKERGILLAIASKNEESTALEAIAKHPEMVLRPEDFVTHRINWNDKAGNIADLLQELNLGAQNVLFIDDNPVERSRVKEFLPEVLVPDWPTNKLLYDRTLRSLPVFDLEAISTEDRQRTRLYHEEKQREHAKTSATDVDAWLRSLGMHVTVAPVDDADFARAHQLLNKTNQFNLTTARPTEKELRERLNDPNRPMWSLRVRDRFGDAGLTGLLGLDLTHPEHAVITDLVLSCRVMGRRVEETLLHLADAQARAQGKRSIIARLIPTAKNKPCLSFLESSGWSVAADGPSFTWDLSTTYPLPDTLQLEQRDAPPST